MLVRNDIEADNHGVRRIGQGNIRDGDASHRGLEDSHLNFRMFEFAEFFLDRFDRPTDIRADDQVQYGDLVLLAADDRRSACAPGRTPRIRKAGNYHGAGATR